MGIAIALIVLMVITAVLSLVWIMQVESRIQGLTNITSERMDTWRGRISVLLSGRWHFVA